MERVTKVLSDIFAMSFDIIIPLSGCIVALVVAFFIFMIRYVSFRYNKRRFERRQKKLDAEEAAEKSAAVLPDEATLPVIETASFFVQNAKPCIERPESANGPEPEAAEATQVYAFVREAPAVLESAKFCDAITMNILLSAVANADAQSASAELFRDEMKKAALSSGTEAA